MPVHKNYVFYLIIFFLGSITIGHSQCTAIIDFEVVSGGYLFTDVSSVSSGDSIVHRTWDFGDNSTSHASSVTHNYSSPGIYEVSLVIETALGCIDTAEMVVENCALGLDYTLGDCNNQGLVSIAVRIDDIFNSLESVKVFLDGVELEDSPLLIPQGVLNLNMTIPGDGQLHSILVESGLTGMCSEQVSFFVEDCASAGCFLHNLVVDDAIGEEHNILVLDSMFSPNNKIITLGDKVRFIWMDNHHSTTSVDTTGFDAWDSGVQDSSYIFTIEPRFPGLKPFYSSSDDSTYIGNIIANCPASKGNLVQLSFDNSIFLETGFYVSLDGVVLHDIVYPYDNTGHTEIEFFLPGDGKSHQIGIVDVADPSCTLVGTAKAINCNGILPCAINIDAYISARCNLDSLVEVTMDFSTLSEDNQEVFVIQNDTVYLDTVILVDGHAQGKFLFPGDGLTHTFSIRNVADTLCLDEVAVRLDDCNAPCSIDNLDIGTGSNNTIVLGLTNTQVTVGQLIMASGDDVLWQWLGDSLLGIRSIDTLTSNAWDSGLLSKGSIFISPVLSPGHHDYFLYDASGDTLMMAVVEVLAACEENRIPIFYTFEDVNGSMTGYDIYVDGQRLQEGPFEYALDGHNKGTFQIEGDDMSHEIEIRDVSNPNCSSVGDFLAPVCEIPPCGGTIDVQPLDSCYNDNTIQVVISVFHPDPDPNGFIFRINGEIYGGQAYTYDSLGKAQFTEFLAADSSVYEFTYMDILDNDCVDTVVFQSPKCITDCHLEHVSTSLVGEEFVYDYPDTPDSLIGCIDSFVYVAVRFTEVYSDAEGYDIYLDGALLDTTMVYNEGDGYNMTFLRMMGDSGFHTITLVDKVDQGCGFDTYIQVPLCYSPCNITIGEIVTDSCVMETGYYTIVLDSTSNSTSYNVYYDQDSLGVFSVDNPRVLARGDGLDHRILLVDEDEPLCRDSMTFTAAYCLDCNLDIEPVLLDSCEFMDHVRYAFLFNDDIAYKEWIMQIGDSSTVILPYYYFNYVPFEVVGDSSVYEVTFTAVDDPFCTKTFIIQTPDCTPVICQPGFDYQVDGLTITFTDTSVTSEPINDMSWSINDIVNIDHVSSFNYTVDSIGYYHVCHYIVTDSCSGSTCVDVLVGDPCSMVIPRFSVEKINDGYQFTNQSEGKIDHYLYSFGDGIFSNSSDPFHIYSESGNYEVCLTVRQEEFDCEKIFCDSLHVLISNVKDIEDPEVKIYPNPFGNGDSILAIEVKDAGKIIKNGISLTALSGKRCKIKVSRKSNHLLWMDVQEYLPAGVYLVSIRTDRGIITERVVLIE